MKSEMPYRGVSAPNQRAIYRDLFSLHPITTWGRWRATILTLWRDAGYREERYAAIELSGYHSYRDFQTLDTLPLYEEIITTGAWWDYVDAVAIHRVGAYLLARYPKEVKRILLRWSRDEDLWKRRTSIIAQVSFKDATDLRLLYRCIENNLGDTDFFIRKAIGWALRSYAWVDPAEVKRYVSKNETTLSPLSKREALKNVSGGRTRKRSPR